MNKGVISTGIKAPMIKQGDDIVKIVVDAVLDATAIYNNGYDFSNDEPFYYDIQDNDVIGVTESVVARAQGNYVTLDEIVQFLNEMHITKNLILYSPIMSRNRFSMILKAFARYADSIEIIYEGKYDEQGNPNEGINPFTGVDIKEYYRGLCENENCKFEMHKNHVDYHYHKPRFYQLGNTWMGIESDSTFIDCRCHPTDGDQLTLKDIMCVAVTRDDGSMSGLNTEYGLLGSNKSTEEKLKLFPEPAKAQEFVEAVQKEIFNRIKKHVIVCVYGDGCFKDPVGGIWEFADPVTMPAYTDKELIESTPNEIKLKAFIDQGVDEEEINKIIEDKHKNLVGSMLSQGTTPRLYRDLLASLMDLTSGSGDRCTPIILIQNYFR